MSGIYTLSVETNISSAHSLHGYDGDCAKMHGHNWKIIAEISAKKLNKIGMVIDFKILKKEIKKIGKLIDHTYLNDVHPFNKINPTAENIAYWFYEELTKKINDDNIKVKSITVYETETSKATYSLER